MKKAMMVLFVVCAFGCSNTFVDLGECESDLDCADGDECTVDICGVDKTCISIPSDSPTCDVDTDASDDGGDVDADADADVDITPDDYEGDEPGECGDGADNDRDGLFDCADPGCAGSSLCERPGADADADADADVTDVPDTDYGVDADADADADVTDTGCVPAEETCDDLDNDCDGETDEGLLIPYYRDGDGDGYGDSRFWIMHCPVTFMVEGATTAGDCNDGARQIYPGALERCDGEDNDCDGEIDEGFAAVCGRAPCTTVGAVAICYECPVDDRYGTALGASYCSPDHFYGPCECSVCGDGICLTIGSTQENCPADCGTPTCGDGVCNGFETFISCPSDCDVPSVPTCGDGTCNGFETLISCPSDCSDGGCPLDSVITCYYDTDHDGYGISGAGVSRLMCPRDCVGDWAPSSGDCNNLDPDIFPGAEEVCDAEDNDCDGATDEGVPSCGVGFPCHDSEVAACICDSGAVGTTRCGSGPLFGPCACPVCGDGVCNNGETLLTCGRDCGYCRFEWYLTGSTDPPAACGSWWYIWDRVSCGNLIGLSAETPTTACLDALRARLALPAGADGRIYGVDAAGHTLHVGVNAPATWRDAPTWPTQFGWASASVSPP